MDKRAQRRFSEHVVDLAPLAVAVAVVAIVWFFT
jgi:hypothetical protein